MIRKFAVLFVSIGFIAAGVVAFIAMGFLKSPPERVEEAARPVSVFVETARIEDVRLSVFSQGEVRPFTEIDLVPQVSGKIVWVAPRFAGGGIFAKDEPLIRIEDADYRFAVVSAQAQVAQARQVYEREKAEAELARREWEELGEGEASPLTLRVPQLAEALAALNAAQAELDNAELNLDRTVLRAPFPGRVRTKQADIGQYVTPGQALGRIFSTEKVEVRLPLSDHEFGLLNLPFAFDEREDFEGPPVHITATVAGRPHEWRGRIVRTDAAVDSQTRTLFAITEVEDPYGAGADDGMPLAVGLFVSAQIEGRALEDAIVLPRAALRGKNTVYVVDEDNKLRVRQVAVVYTNPEQAVLSDGVRYGERVIVSAIETPFDGMDVQPLSADDADGDQISEAIASRAQLGEGGGAQ